MSAGAATLLVASFLAPLVQAEAVVPPQTHALLINGGQSPPNNALSHLHHLQDMVEALTARGIPTDRIHVNDLVIRDSLDPRLWLIEGLPLGRSLRRADLTNTVWDEVELKPATLPELRRWFRGTGRKLGSKDTLLVFVTDHGKENKKDPANGYISLWNESLSVLEFRALLAHLSPETRVINVMSQCFSGVFARSMSPLHDDIPGGNVCGFYSTTADRPAYGCYPEGRDKDRMGHAFRFIDAMGRNHTMDEAHREVLLTDLTPDVPLRTTDVFFERLLQRMAERGERKLHEYVDDILALAWRDRGHWEPEIRLLDRLGSVYGVFSPRSLAEFLTHIESLQSLSNELRTYQDRWLLALNDLRRDNLQRFLDENPDWDKRLQKKKVDDLSGEAKKKLTAELLDELELFTREREEVGERLERLNETYEEAQTARYRVEVRLAALLRMRTILLRVAAQQYFLATEESGIDERDKLAAALARLETCEATGIGGSSEIDESALVPETLAPFEEDLEIVKRVMPSWLGLRFGVVPDEQREELRLEKGAAIVRQVFEDSAAGNAGIRPGDIILGPPGEPFDEPRRMREWIMGSPRGTPLTLELLREDKQVEVTVSLDPFPTELPRLPAPPAEGDQAPALPALRLVSGAAGAEKQAAHGRHVLFFWATWCGPCKQAVPELLSWSESTGVPVLAVSDENPTKIQSFLDSWSAPFPELVLADELRLSYVSYGVSGTPSFVLIDDAGRIEWRQTGYVPRRGLGAPE